MTTVTTKPLVLARLSPANGIVDTRTGQPLPAFVQTLNNAWENISTAFAALAQREADQADLLAQIVTLNGLVTSTQGQVSAILAERQTGILSATVVITGTVRGAP